MYMQSLPLLRTYSTQGALEDSEQAEVPGVQAFAYLLLAVGAFVFLIAGLGCCGAVKKSKFLLVVVSHNSITRNSAYQPTLHHTTPAVLPRSLPNPLRRDRGRNPGDYQSRKRGEDDKSEFEE